MRCCPWVRVAVCAVVVAACGTGSTSPDSAADAGHRWPCPTDWVASVRGGCGPAVALCARAEALDPAGCAGENWSAPRTFAGDGGVTVGQFGRVSDAGPVVTTLAGGTPHLAGEWTCPGGWTRGVSGGCVPTLRTDCGANSAPLPDGTCVRTSEQDCAAGEYPDPGPEAAGARLAFVRADAATTGADGTRDRPFARIADGIALVGPDGWVLLAAGSYSERIRVNFASGTAHILGVCAARVTVSSPTGAVGATVQLDRGGLDLRGVRIAAGSQAISTRGDFRAERVRIEGTDTIDAIAVVAGTALIRDSSFALQSTTADATASIAIGGGAATLEHVSGVSQTGVGASVMAGARLTLTDVALAFTTFRSAGGGVIGDDGATIDLTRVAVIDPPVAGLSVHNRATVTAIDLYVRGAIPSPGAVGMGSDWYGHAIHAVGGTTRGARVTLESTAGVGLFASTQADVSFDDVAIRGTTTRADGSGGPAVFADLRARVSLHGCVLADNTVAGAIAVRGSTLRMDECVVRGTRGDSTDRFGRGISVHGGVVLDLRRTVISAVREIGLAITGPSSNATLEDVWVEGVSPSAFGLGVGVMILGTSQASIARLAIAETMGAALVGGPPEPMSADVGGSALSVEDLWIRTVRSSTVQYQLADTRIMPVGRIVAYGLHAGAGATVDVTRALIDGGGFGIFVAGGRCGVRTGVIAQQLDGFAATAGGPQDRELSLVDVTGSANAGDTVLGQQSLPASASLPPPTSVCERARCE